LLNNGIGLRKEEWYVIIQKSKPPAHTIRFNKCELESERQRLYSVADRFNLTSKRVIEQSNIVDKHILEDLKCQFSIKPEPITKKP
jgi:hypothetical protein